MNLRQVLSHMKTAANLAERITAWQVTEANEGSFADLPPGLDPRLVCVLGAKGIERLFTHQVAAIQAAQRGER